jgi:hypothetical protein
VQLLTFVMDKELLVVSVTGNLHTLKRILDGRLADVNCEDKVGPVCFR